MNSTTARQSVVMNEANARAARLRKENATLTEAQAIARVFAEDPKLYAAYEGAAARDRADAELDAKRAAEREWAEHTAPKQGQR